jgi:hypothetical protein
MTTGGGFSTSRRAADHALWCWHSQAVRTQHVDASKHGSSHCLATPAAACHRVRLVGHARMHTVQHIRKALLVHAVPPYELCTDPLDLAAQLNAVIDTVMQQTAKFDTQTELFNRLMDTNANATINNSTLAPVQTDLELLLDPQYWNALGSTFVDVVCSSVRGARSVGWRGLSM